MTATTHRLLLVEDNEPLGRQMVAELAGAGYETTWIRRGDEALAAAFEEYSLVILDLMLPGASGFDVLGRLRRHGARTPVLITSSRTDSRDKLRALDLGASEYLTKPFWPQELLDRVAVHLQGSEPQRPSETIDIGALAIDLAARSVRVAGARIDLTRFEFDVLAVLARRHGSAVSRAWLLAQVARDPDANSKQLDACVRALADKLSLSGVRIKAVWGVGFRLDA